MYAIRSYYASPGLKFIPMSKSSLIWDGNPYDAIIDLQATYKLKTSIKDLVPAYLTDESSGDIYSRRIPINCNLLLKDRLLNPAIQFEILSPRITSYNVCYTKLLRMVDLPVPETAEKTYPAPLSLIPEACNKNAFSTRAISIKCRIPSGWKNGSRYKSSTIHFSTYTTMLFSVIFTYDKVRFIPS